MALTSSTLKSFRPWQSAWMGGIVAGLFLLVGVPLFLRMPLWCDVTLYQTAAQSVLAGGAHYRDTFDTNPPGFVWCACLVEVLLGSSSEAYRAVDFFVAMMALGLALRIAKLAGANRAGIAWAVAAWASFYPFLVEVCHVQRDTWMLLPALAAVSIRIARMNRAVRSPVSNGFLFGSGMVEGIVWSLGFWIKPHIVLPAAAVWFASAGPLGRTASKPRIRRAVDLAGVIAGAALIIAVGIVWMIRTDAWDSYLDVNRNWNNGYLRLVFIELVDRVRTQLQYFPPWSWLFVVAVPLALVNLFQYKRDHSISESQQTSRTILAALYLSWAFTAMLTQRGFNYVHVPETMLMLAVFAANRWPVPCIVLILHFALGGWFLVDRHPILDGTRTRHWATCFDADMPREVRRDIGFATQYFSGLDPVELGAVADYLRDQHVGNGELIAWHDSPQALYPMLGIRPGIRFLHVSTVQQMGQWKTDSRQYQRLRAEVAAAVPHARFAVTDMFRIAAQRDRLHDLSADGLPQAVPRWQAGQFPLDRPILFRSPNGRYLVHDLRGPAPFGDCKILSWPDEPHEW